MLVLSRQRDESIMIGDDVEIIIVDVRGDKVRLGITAPKEIPVHRREIYDAIQREKGLKKEPQSEHPEKPQTPESTKDS
ncbi:MAG: carbon storage regulator CsrA [Planctomycetes bacterium]|nr:carbon storage regulator CsrA [Planctomycetota bacterium]MBL7145649.1 carbon storage regulator CsrA [Phycisphaerae bacterium]